MNTGRLLALADGVFAIVMTLLVFEMRVPETARDLDSEVLDLLPNLLSYMVSFIILGVYWVGHHSQFQFIKKADQNLLWLNIAFLMCVSLVPFSAGMLGRHGDQQISVIVYGVNLIFVALAHFAMWRYATRRYRLVETNLDSQIVALGSRLSLIPIGIYVLAILLSFVSTILSIVLYALVPIPYVSGHFYRIK